MDDGVVALTKDEAPTGPRRRLRVGVLVDLPLGVRAGGHVRCWERLAEAALGFAHRLDLTVHFAGPVSECRPLGETVRYAIERPVFSTERLRFLSHVPDHTDLAHWHPALARALRRYDVIHTTDAYFAYARTAIRVGENAGIPVVNSIHTNTPEYARIFTAQTVERVFGKSILARLLLERVRIGERVEASMRRRLAAYQRRCAYVLLARPDEAAEARARLGARVGLLRRGIDHALFHPQKRDRHWLAEEYGIPPARLVLIYVGRLNRGKNVRLLIEAVAQCLTQGVDAHLLCVGEGDDRAEILRRLGPRATCPGAVAPAELARLYASADLFVFPSQIEESANVVREALASGLPALVASEGGMGRLICDATGCVLPGVSVAAWRDAIAALATEPQRRAAMRVAARRQAEDLVPSWADVLATDLLPVWQSVALRAPAPAARQAVAAL